MAIFFEYLFKGWVVLWMTLIAIIPNLFMGALTLAVFATWLTYKEKDESKKAK